MMTEVLTQCGTGLDHREDQVYKQAEGFNHSSTQTQVSEKGVFINSLTSPPYHKDESTLLGGSLGAGDGCLEELGSGASHDGGDSLE